MKQQWRGSCYHAVLTVRVSGNAVELKESAPVEDRSNFSRNGASGSMWAGSRRSLSPAGPCRSGCSRCGMEPGSLKGSVGLGIPGQRSLAEDGDKAKSSSGRMVILSEPLSPSCSSWSCSSCHPPEPVCPAASPGQSRQGVGGGCAPGSQERSVQLWRCVLTL